MVAQNPRQSVRLMFQDEAGFGRNNKPKSCWCKKGKRPSVPCHHIREYRYVYGAVEPKNLLSLNCTNNKNGRSSSLMNSISQDMKYLYSLMKYIEKHSVAQASRRYNKGRSYIYYWKSRFDGSIGSLACRSRRPHRNPNQHTEAVLP